MLRLKDKVAVITAAGSGMGRASAVLFAQEGAKVVVTDIDAPKGRETVRLIEQAGGSAVYVKADVTRLSDMKGMVDAAVRSYGALHILFNHAGAPGPFKLEEVTEKDWEACLEVNTKGAFFATQCAVPEMKKAGGGSIIFTSSVAGLVGSKNLPVYSLAKGGLVNMTRALALLLAPHNIRVNCLCPGGIETPMTTSFMQGTPEQKKAALEGAKRATPLGRLGRPEEVAYAALFLASDEASFVTAAALPVDGGLQYSRG